MTTPLPWVPGNDPVPSSVRQQRDQYFDELIGLPSALTPANVKSTGFSLGVPLPNQTEIPVLPDRAVVIASFSSYQPVLSRSGRSIYTEVTFSVSNSFQDPAGGIKTGSTIVLILPGGTVRTEAGLVLSFLTQPRRYFVAPGRIYLLALSFHSVGNFYSLGKNWDLTTGVVQQNFGASKQAPSTLVGLTVPQLITTLNAQFGIN
jgi:hypothetical protein